MLRLQAHQLGQQALGSLLDLGPSASSQVGIVAKEVLLRAALHHGGPARPLEPKRQ